MINLILIYLTIGVVLFAVGEKSKLGSSEITISKAFMFGANTNSGFVGVVKEEGDEPLTYEMKTIQWFFGPVTVNAQFLKRREDLDE